MQNERDTGAQLTTADPIAPPSLNLNLPRLASTHHSSGLGLDGMASGESPEQQTACLGSRGGGGDQVVNADRDTAHATPSTISRQEAQGATEAEWAEAHARASVLQEFLRLRADGLSLNQAAARLGRSPCNFSGVNSPLARYQREGVAGLLPNRRNAGAPARFDVPDWFVPVAKFFYVKTNRTKIKGSIKEAIRRTISLPTLPIGWKASDKARFLRAIHCDDVPACPQDLRALILDRQDAGQELVPERIARQISCPDTVVEYDRNPTNARLRTVNAAGSSKFVKMPSGEYVPLRCGYRMMPDDGSINFMCTVPWKFPTDACSRKWGVMVGRFQLLLFVDTLSNAIRARSFVVRPRSSYRQEDAIHLYNIFMREHGLPWQIWHEGHVWNAGRVKDCLDLLKVERQLLHSPHAKQAVEGRFNKLWTVMSALTNGQIGRFRGEMERENKVLASVQAGHTDPTTVFPSLELALQVIDQAIAEANATPVTTDVGTWVPDELWAEQLADTPLRRLEPGTEWMFAPWCVERSIRNGINTTVPLFEDFSVPFTFAAEWMPAFHGAKTKCYFDPYLESCKGTVVLAEDFNGTRAGTVMGEATQTNNIAEYARLMLGLGTGPNDAGRVMRQRQQAALRSDRRAIVGGGRGVTVVEQRDGTGVAARVEVDSTAAPTAPQPEVTTTRSNILEAAAPLSRPAAEDPSLAEFLED